MFLFCRHDPKLLSETTTESKIEHVIKVAPEIDKFSADHSSMARKHIQVFVCTKCGKLTRYVENI